MVILDTIQVYDGTGEKPALGPAAVHLEFATPWRWFGLPEPFSTTSTKDKTVTRQLRFYLPEQSQYLDRKIIAKLQRAIDRPGSTIVLTHRPVEGKGGLEAFGRETYGPFTLIKVEKKLGGYLPGRYVWLTWERDPLVGEAGYEGVE